MYENTVAVTRAVLVSVDVGEFDQELSLQELEALAQTAQAEVVGVFTQKRDTYDAATCTGAGLLREIAEFCQQYEVNLLVFDHELSGTQLRNIEAKTLVRVIDRTMLILDIFAQRARSKEGQLQVELAQLRYRLPRLIGLGTALSRLGGGIGTRGPGETQLETDRRHIHRRIKALELELNRMEKRRAMIRQRRKKIQLPVVAIVGYTNAGKSTLFNALTSAQVLEEDKLFATLDPTARALGLPDGRTVLLVDTVGFISRLPHHLVEAFRSTLEEATEADLILHLCDLSNPQALQQTQVVKQILADLGCADTPALTVWNQCDRVGFPNDAATRDEIYISAKTGVGFERLLQAIAQSLAPTALRSLLLLPYAEAHLLSEIRRRGKVFSERFTDQGIEVDAMVDRSLAAQARPYQIKEELR